MSSTVEVTLDALLGGRVLILQPKDGYRVALDTVLLAAAVPARPGERVLDAGIGSGGAALCLATRLPEVTVTGLDHDGEALKLAASSIERNGLDERIDLVEGDIADPPAALVRAGFDHVMTNPPYLPREAMTLPRSAGRVRAHGAVLDMASWIAGCLGMLKPMGRLTLIQRADRLDEILAGMRGSAGEVTVLPLWPKAAAAEARRVLVSARKGARGPARLLRGLVLHGADGAFTAETEAVLRDGAALPF